MVERDELHRRIMALRDAMAEGKLVFAEHLGGCLSGGPWPRAYRA